MSAFRSSGHIESSITTGGATRYALSFLLPRTTQAHLASVHHGPVAVCNLGDYNRGGASIGLYFRKKITTIALSD